MPYLPRLIEPRLSRLAATFPVVVVQGARQVGKSTLLQHLFGAHAHSVVFDPVQDIGNARADPELFLRLRPPPLILDEVQFAPELLPAVKRAVDGRPGMAGQYFITGSQQLAVLGRVQESLAGRAVLLELPPLAQLESQPRPGPAALETILTCGQGTAADLLSALAQSPRPAGARGLLQRLYRGGYPALLGLDDRDVPEWMGSYIRTYVERDVRTVRDVADAHEFHRFLRLAAALTAQELNLSQLGRQIGIAPKTALGWLQALRASFLVLELPAWSGNAVKRVAQRPKIHLADTGLACQLLAVSSPQALGSHPQLGSLFESFVAAELARQACAMPSPPRFYHWRSNGGAEVDVVMERDGVLHPVEVKLASRPSRRDARGLAAFAETYRHGRVGAGVVVHGGAELELLDERTVALPVDWL